MKLIINPLYIVLLLACSYTPTKAQYIGGIDDGFAIGTKLTNCVPTPLPILQNIALGGIEDGFAIGTK
ncbi:MAG: hypothetical protein ABL940_10925, partial [Bacteroidia bacterium]